MYHSVVLGVYRDLGVRKLDTFHCRCIRCIVGVGRTVQWAEHITFSQLAEDFGMLESVGNLLSLARLRWLSHIACVSDDHIPENVVWMATSNTSCSCC